MDVYRHPSSMEPLLPKAQGGHLSELTCDIQKAAGRLTGQVHSPHVFQRVAGLVREMNCYYSNLIEGHKTIPRDIERALKRDFSADAGQRDNQQLSLAHLAVEKLLEERLAGGPVDVYAPEFVCWLHREFYARLPESLHWASAKDGKTRYRIKPGSLRDFMVDVGRHTPPHFAALPQFLDRFHAFYGDDRILETDRLVVIAAAHHRLAWIHPFGDGNGRVVRLQSQALLRRHGIGHGLWTLSRGLARGRQRYYACLESADCSRQNDLDGRGNLSDAALAEFCVFFLETMLDQIQFMSGLLDLPTLRTRVERYFQFEPLHLKRYREELMRVVRALVDEGEIPRSRVQEITGKGATVSAEIIKLGLNEDFFETPSPKGALQAAFPAKLHEFYFPQLFLDLPVEPPSGSAA